MPAAEVVGFLGVNLASGLSSEEIRRRQIVDLVKGSAAGVEGVAEIEKCRTRKSGLHLSMDIHVAVDGDLSMRCGHAIAHHVKDRPPD